MPRALVALLLPSGEEGRPPGAGVVGGALVRRQAHDRRAPARSLLFDPRSSAGGRRRLALEARARGDAGGGAGGPSSADGANVAIIGHHKNVTLCSASTSAPPVRRQRRDERVHCVALDHDGGRLLLGTFQQPTVRGKAELYHQGAGTSFYHFQGADTVRCVCYHPQLHLLAIAGDAVGKGTVYVYEVKSSSPLNRQPLVAAARRRPHGRCARATATGSPSAATTRVAIATCSASSRTRGRSAGRRSRPAPRPSASGSLPSVKHRRRRRPAAGRRRRRGRPSADALQPVKSIKYGGFIWSTQFSGDGNAFAVGSWDKHAYLYDVRGGEFRERFKLKRDDRVYAVDVSKSAALVGGRPRLVRGDVCDRRADVPPAPRAADAAVDGGRRRLHLHRGALRVSLRLRRHVARRAQG